MPHTTTRILASAPLTLALAALIATGCAEAPEQSDANAPTEEPIQSPTSQPDTATDPQDWGVLRAGSTDVPTKPEGAIRLAAYNVLNLFDEIDDPTPEGYTDDWHDSRSGLRGKPAEQLQAVADAIRALDADVVALQEIESLAALTSFRDTYLADMGYDYVVSKDMDHRRSIEQSVLSRFPVTDSTVWPNMPLEGNHPADLTGRDADLAGQPLMFRRGPLRAVVEVPDDNGGVYELVLFVVHHKSGRDFTYWRNAEVDAVLGLVRDELARNPDANIAVLGDFNAMASQPPVRKYTEEAGMIDVKAAHGLTGTAAITHASGRTIDFIMVNTNLAPEIVDGSAFVYATPLRPREMDWRNTPTPPGYAADHMPVTVDLIPTDR